MSDNLPALYEAVYADPLHAAYGSGLKRCAEFLPRIRRASLHSVLSFGCGRGDELLAIHATVPFCLGIDFALPPAVLCNDETNLEVVRIAARVRGDIADPGFRYRGFDAVVSFDVLEHVREDQLDQVLKNAREAAPRACLVIANMSDPHTLPDGRVVDLHLIQRPAPWWMERVARVTGWSVELQELPYPKRFGIWCGEWP